MFSNPDKVIVTTATKVRLLQNLSEFWSLKSIFIQARKDPHLLASETFQQRALEYFEKSSGLANQKFWTSLSVEARKKAAKYFVLQEIRETTNTRMTVNNQSAAIYVVLNGSATVKTGDNPDETVYNTGEIFGAVDVFNQAFDNVELTEQRLEEAASQPVITASMKKGTYLRISLADFCKHVLTVDKPVRGVDQDEYSRIAEMRWEDLTDEDKYYIEIYMKVRKILKKDIFDFASTFKLIPCNARHPAKRFFKEGHTGHSIELNPSGPFSLFIILDGGIRIEIETRRNKSSSNTIACKRKGKNPMVIKTYSMPIIILEGGSILSILRESFSIGSNEPAKKQERANSPQKGATDVGQSDSLTRTAPLSPASNPRVRRDSISSQSSLASTATPRSSSRGNNDTENSSAPLYKICLVFEKVTSYLEIPMQLIDKHLDDRIVPRSMAEGELLCPGTSPFSSYLCMSKLIAIRSQFQQVGEHVLHRIENLRPWIMGNLAFNGPPILSSAGDYSAAPLADNLFQAKASAKKSG
eukprot:scaffold2799_cov159-Ochromonas_danica.AAC.25